MKDIASEVRVYGRKDLAVNKKYRKKQQAIPATVLLWDGLNMDRKIKFRVWDHTDRHWQIDDYELLFCQEQGDF